MSEVERASAGRVLAGVTSDTFKSLQLGPGAIIKNFEYHGITTYNAFHAAMLEAIKNGQSFGGTEGGINIEITPTYGRYPIDGATARFKGDSFITDWLCQMSTNLKEFDPKTLAAAFPTSEFIEVGDNDILAQRIRAAISPEDYDDNHTWIATTKFGYLMVSFFNALGQTTGAIAAPSTGSGNLPFQSVGHVEDFDDIDFAPCEIWYVYRDGRPIQGLRVGTGG